MKPSTSILAIVLCATCTPIIAQNLPAAGEFSLAQTTLKPGTSATASSKRRLKLAPPKPFSVVALGGGISAMGVNMQAATNMNRFMNLRVVGNYFKYNLSNINTNGFNVSGNLNFATAGASVDLYPFPSHGLRLSPGVLFLNDNAASATITASAGTSFTLNNVTYYSAAASPVAGVASLGLNTTKPAATMTIGWGNMIPRYSRGHWSFPFELGAAFIGQPSVNLALSSGQVCTNPQGTLNCQSVTNDATLNSNVQAQIAKYQSDLQPFKYYPIVSIGVGYNFNLRHSRE